ncbi:MAG: hypothetical protein H6741_06355 [Alphaproteobacteria bacterium]|nr:hypothetical protein [Alphaproteobacteria bacterium]MCB9792332.1 hypothetical protein [Alphaproteobacteria bacterium]
MSALQPARPLPSSAAALAFAAGAAICAVLLPLATYSVTLAAFGLAHVLTELRFVDGRFSDRARGRLRQGLLLLLGGVVLVRLGRLGGQLDAGTGYALELGLVAGLMALALPALPAAARGLGALLIAGVGLGATFAPIPTLLLLAVLHNWTPVGFLAEATEGAERQRVMGLCALLFLGLPLLIASGLPGQALAALSVPDWSPLPTGPLSAHLGAYLPQALKASTWAVPLFSAVVFAQCMHYGVVIHVLPRLAGRPEPGPLARLDARTFTLSLLVLGGALLVAFALDFKQARSVYGLAAAVHAWVELPLLLLALAPGVAR